MSLTKQEIEIRKGYAFRLFMSGESQKSIARTVGTTEATVSRWAGKEEWDKKKQEQNTSTLALANSMMAAARKMSELIISNIENGNTDIGTITKCSDNLVKIMAAAERIAKTVTRATVIDVVIALDRWLVQRAEVDERLSPEMLESITGFHRKYIEYITSNETRWPEKKRDIKKRSNVMPNIFKRYGT